MPLELYTLWQQYPWQLGGVICWLRALVPEATAYASILTIVTFSTEQYIAVCHPLRPPVKSKVPRAIRNIVIIWLLSTLAASPYAVFMRVNYLAGNGRQHILESAWCGFPFNEPDRSWETLMLCSTFLFFVVPMTLISVLYVRIAMALHTTRPLQRAVSEGQTCHSGDGQRAKIQSRRIVIRMLIAVVIAFFLCWAPFHSQRLLFLYVSLYGEWSESLRKINQDLFSLAGGAFWMARSVYRRGCFYYSNSTINPILYSVMSKRFRVAFRNKLCAGNPGTCFLCCCCCCWEWWRDLCLRRSYRVSSCRDSSSGARSQLGQPPNEPAVVTVGGTLKLNSATNNRQQVSLREEENSSSKKKRLFTGVSLSEGKKENEGVLLSDLSIHPQYKSDPNFSMRQTDVGDFVTADSFPEVNKELAMAINEQMDSLQSDKEDEAGCSTCGNLVFQTKLRVGVLPLEGKPTVLQNGDSDGADCAKCSSLFQNKPRLTLYQPISKSSTSGGSNCGHSSTPVIEESKL